MKTPRAHVAALAALAALTVAATSQAGPGSGAARPTTFSVAGPVTALAADGFRVAIAERNPRGCDSALVWTAPGKTVQTYVSKFSCAGTAFHDITEIAIAGNRLEWLATAGGNFQDMAVEAATLGRTRIARVASAENEGGAAGGVDGDWLGHLVGHGTLLVYNSWHECAISRRQGAPACTPGQQVGGIFYSNQTLQKLVGLSRSRIRSGPDALVAVAVDGDRVALENLFDSSTFLIDSRGRRLTQNVAAGANGGSALQGGQVVTLHGASLQIWDALTGHLNGIVSIPPGTGTPLLRDLQAGVAVYVRGRAVHVLRFADSKQTAFVVPVKAVVDAQLESAGLFYAYNLARGKSRGRVVFVPWSQLEQKLH
jgi:hypothetical protein